MRRTFHSELADALDQLQAETAEAANRPPAKAVDLKFNRYESGERVVMRAEIRGPQRWFAKVCAGIDVWGDGRLSVWSGSGRRSEVEPRGKETAWHALRRELGI